jgi:HD-GYP domain-containing protein (c-di-GMP phosphodiesterase class II)
MTVSENDTRPEEERLETAEEIAEIAAPSSKSPFSTAKRLSRAKELLRSLAVAHTNSSLYPATHPLVTQSVEELVSAVANIVELGFEEVTVNIYKNTLFVENQVFPEESVTFRRLVEKLLEAGVSALTLGENLGATDAAALIDLLGADDVRDIGTARRFLAERNAGQVAVAETTTLEEIEQEKAGKEAKAQAKASYDTGVGVMRDVETQAKLGKVFDVQPLQDVVNGLLDSLLKDPAAVLGLTAIKDHDNYTLNHSINVCILAISLGATLGLDEDSLGSLGLSALLYDLGKVRIPEDILLKQEPLTADEWEIIKSHTSEGADLLKRIQLVDQMPMIVAYEHHQRHDQEGYPHEEEGSEQHLFSKVVALCDAYDAMTTRRPFRREIRPDKAVAVLMQGRGKAYDPSLTKAFVAMLGIYPMGAVVSLDDGTKAVVFRVNRDDLLRPRVKVLIDADGRWYEDPELVDLRLVDPETGGHQKTITECVPSSEAGVDDVWEYL